MVLSTTRGDYELHRAFTIAPAIENIRSEGALVAGTAKMHRARDANLLYVSVWLLHQLKRSSVWTPIQWCCWISRSWVKLKMPYRCSKSIFAFFHDGAVEWLFSLVDGLSPSSWKIAVHRLMKHKSQSEPTFWPKTCGVLVKAACRSYIFGGGSATIIPAVRRDRRGALVYTHRHHLILLLSPKADTHFTIPQNVEGWVDLVTGIIPGLFTCQCPPPTAGHPYQY